MIKFPKVLVLDDDDLARRSISSVLKEQGWIVEESKCDKQPAEIASAGNWDVVICELAPERGYGFDVLRILTKDRPKTKVVLTTSDPNPLAALDAIRLGAFEYLTKPVAANELLPLSKSLRQRVTSGDFVKTDRSEGCKESSDRLIGRSRSFIEVMKQVGRVAATSLPVLLTGESGTGKEVVAVTIHQRSERRDRPFVAVNCAAIPATLIEAELFGHEKGSFTGADRERPGLFEQAAGGTILLDEIAETTLSFQVKLLRVLESGEVRRVGSNQNRRLDVRVIAATNRDVERDVEAGRFRQDLFYRLNAVAIRLPSLRERREDIPLFVESFAWQVAGKTKLRFSSEVLELLRHYPWPGNVRELEHTIMGCVAMSDGLVLPEDLPVCIRNYREPIGETPKADVVSEREDWVPLSNVESEYVARVLAHTKWNKQAAARILQIDRKTLDRTIKRYSIMRTSSSTTLVQDRRAA